jgi:uncharacterized delta-60 repeat protein
MSIQRFAVALLLLFPTAASASPGAPDPEFGTAGVAPVTGIVGTLKDAREIVLAPDGKLLLGIAADSGGYVVRLNPDGSPDTSYGGGDARAEVPGVRAVYDIVLRADGRVVGTGASVTDGVANTAVFRLTAAGAPDPTFDGDGVAGIKSSPQEVPVALVLDATNRPVVAVTGSDGSKQDALVYRLKPDGGSGAMNGALDPTFDTDGVAGVDNGGRERATDIALDAGGRMLVSAVAEASTGALVYRLKADGGAGQLNGALDPSFDGDGVVGLDGGGNEYAHAVAVDQSGRILVGGYIFPDNGPHGRVWRLGAGGALDGTFAGTGVAKLSIEVNSLALDPTGRIIVGGNTDGTPTAAAAHRLTPSGAADTSFGVGGTARLPDQTSGYGIALQTDGKVVSAGRAQGEPAAFRLLGDPAPEPGATPTPTATASATPTVTPTGGGGGGGTSTDTDTDSGKGEAQGFGDRARVTLRPLTRRGVVRVALTNFNPFAVRGRLSGGRVRARKVGVAAEDSAVVRVRLRAGARRRLKRTGRLRVKLSAVVRDPAGATRIVRASVVLRR